MSSLRQDIVGSNGCKVQALWIICGEADNKKQEAMSWVLVCLSVAGVVLNVRRDRRGFLLWMISNIGWMLIDLMHGLYAQAFLFGIYFVLSFWGWVAWKK